MPILITLLVIVVVVIIYGAYCSSKAKKRRDEVIEHTKVYVESHWPDALIVVNDGIHLFFKDDTHRFFGCDESGRTYRFEDLLSIQNYKTGIQFIIQPKYDIIKLGKAYPSEEGTLPINETSVSRIYNEMMPVLRANLRKVLTEHGISSTHEYEIDGEIWGCDVNSRKFYCVVTCPEIFDFSDLRRVSIDDLRNNTLYDGSYIIHIFVKQADLDDMEYEIHIKSPDITYQGLLAMFKGIRNRQ